MDLWEACPKSNHQTSEKHLQTSIHRTSGHHVQIQIHRTSRKHVQISNPSDLWEAHLKLQIHRTSGKHVQIQDHDWNPYFVVTTGKHVLYSFFLLKKKKKLHAWTTFRLDPPTKRSVGNLPWDSVHILIHNMTICIFIYMHHTFTMVKYWLQS